MVMALDCIGSLPKSSLGSGSRHVTCAEACELRSLAWLSFQASKDRNLSIRSRLCWMSLRGFVNWSPTFSRRWCQMPLFHFCIACPVVPFTLSEKLRFSRIAPKHCWDGDAVTLQIHLSWPAVSSWGGNSVWANSPLPWRISGFIHLLLSGFGAFQFWNGRVWISSKPPEQSESAHHCNASHAMRTGHLVHHDHKFCLDLWEFFQAGNSYGGQLCPCKLQRGKYAWPLGENSGQ